MSLKNKFTYEYLPSNLIKALQPLLNLFRDFRSKNNLIRVASVIFRKNINESDYLFFPLSAQYWKKVIGSHYYLYVSNLLNNGIIESSDVTYISDSGIDPVVKGFKIKDSLMNEILIKQNYYGITKSSESIDKEYDGYRKLSIIGFDPDAITIIKKKALGWIDLNITEVMEKYMDLDFSSGISDSQPYKIRILNDKDEYYSTYLPIESAKKLALKQNKTLIYFKNKFILANLEQFERLTHNRLTHHYKWQIRSYFPDNLTFARHDDTLRVYNHLTSLPSSLLQFVRINGDYILQADLKCSQFTILGNLFNYYINHSGKELIALFKKKPTITFVTRMVEIMDKYHNQFPFKGFDKAYPQEDIYNSNNMYAFLEDTLLHDFYLMLQSNLNLKERKYAKNIAFQTLFSKVKPESDYAKKLRDIYPTVMNIINDFKETHGYEKFSVGLQNVESEIFIDHIWKRVRDSGINSFTRHDSLLFPIRQRNIVESIINDVFKHFDFVQKFEYEEFNEKEIWRKIIDETDYLDTVVEEVVEGWLYTLDNKTPESTEDEVNDEEFEQDYDEYIFDQILNLIDQPDSEFKLPSTKRDDYYGYINSETIGCLADLDGIEQEIIDSLEYDYSHMNLDNSDQHFQDKTNEFITYLIERKDDFLFEDDDENEDENTNDPDPEFE